MDSNTKTTKTHQVMAMTTGWGVPHHFQETSTKKVTCQPSDWPKFGIYDLWQLWPALKFDDLDGLQRNMRSCGSAKYQRVGYLEHSKHQETNGNYAFRAQNLGACTFSMFSNHPSVALVPHLVWTEEPRLAGRGGHAGGVVLVLSAGTQWSKISTRSPCKMVSDWLLMIQVKSLGICSNPWKKKYQNHPKSGSAAIFASLTSQTDIWGEDITNPDGPVVQDAELLDEPVAGLMGWTLSLAWSLHKGNSKSRNFCEFLSL